MYWPKEESVSVVARSRLLVGSVLGDACSIRIGKQVHHGHIQGIGKFLCTAYVIDVILFVILVPLYKCCCLLFASLW